MHTRVPYIILSIVGVSILSMHTRVLCIHVVCVLRGMHSMHNMDIMDTTTIN